VLRGFALVAFGDNKISINYKWSGASPLKHEKIPSKPYATTVNDLPKYLNIT